MSPDSTDTVSLPKSEPVLTPALVAVVVVNLLALAGIVVDEAVVETLIGSVILLAGAFYARSKVTPVASPNL